LVRWASADLGPFSTFFTFLDRFLPVFGPYFALFPSMSCAYLYVNNFFPASLAWELHSLQRRERRERREWGKGGKRQGGFNAESAEGNWGEESAKCRVPFESLRALSMVEGQSAEWTANGRRPGFVLRTSGFAPACRDYAVTRCRGRPDQPKAAEEDRLRPAARLLAARL